MSNISKKPTDQTITIHRFIRRFTVDLPSYLLIRD